MNLWQFCRTQTTAAGWQLHATDAAPPEAARVVRLSAAEALRRFQPAVVLGSFVPFDAGVDEAVLACPSVKHYVVLNARIGGRFASRAIWETPGWQATLLDTVSRWMITRHDVRVAHGGREEELIIQHGEAWHFARDPVSRSPAAVKDPGA